MCGIAGIYAPGQPVAREAVGAMIDAIAHRGPDDSGIEIFAAHALALGHRRLSILDLSPLGHQPMSSGEVTVVFNGEIYNFREIRTELEALGWRFRSDSDTEVILAAYRQWGLDAVERFRGMFAFALWDPGQRVLHLCRDRFGVKPLYYSVINGRLAFASELKALNVGGHTARNVDPMALAEYVQYGYVSAPRTIFSDVQMVRPGCIASFGADLRVTHRQYWSARDLYDAPAAQALRSELSRLDEEQLLDRVEATLKKSFEYRMVADVPVGLFLSGGIDSSLVATLLARRSGIELRTFTIGYGESEFDETVYARSVADALGARHTQFTVSPQAALDLAEQLPEIADEPVGDSSLIPTLMVSRLAREHVKVALSADGADELFGGYARYAYCGDFLARRSRVLKGLYRLSGQMLDRLPSDFVASAYAAATRGGPKFAAINSKLRKFVRMSQARSAFEAYDAAASEWSPAETRRLLAGDPPSFEDSRLAFDSIRGADVRDQFMHFDMTRYMPGDLLAKVDRASMYVSLEAREPFLDPEVAQLAAALPLHWKIRGKQNKYILRRLLYRHFPPGFFERPKQGFSAPVGDWLRGPLRQMMLDELSSARIDEFGLLDAQATRGAVQAFLAGGREASPAGMWILLQLQRWAARWLCEPMQPRTVKSHEGASVSARAVAV